MTRGDVEDVVAEEVAADDLLLRGHVDDRARALSEQLDRRLLVRREVPARDDRAWLGLLVEEPEVRRTPGLQTEDEVGGHEDPTGEVELAGGPGGLWTGREFVGHGERGRGSVPRTSRSSLQGPSAAATRSPA